MTYDIPFPPSVNNLFINVGRGRVRSPRYKLWAAKAAEKLLSQHPLRFKGPVELHYQFQEGQDRRKRDLANLEKATTDLLVEHGVIESDDNTVVRVISMCWSRDVVGARVTVTSAT